MGIHVLQLGPYPPPEGGISRNMLAIREEVRRRGDKCSIIATSKSSRTTDDPDVYHPSSPAALLRLLRSLEYDVLHLHLGGDITKRVLALAAACGISGRGKNVLTMHSGAYPLTWEARNASPRSLRGSIFRSFSHLIAVNDAIADVFRRSGASDEQIKIVSPYSLNLPDQSVAVPDDVRIFYQAHSPLLLAVGGLEKDYDPLFQIKVMHDVLAVFPEAGLVIVGDGSMRAEAEAELAQCGYSERILLAGNQDHVVTLHLIKDADVLLRTTLFDGDAISVREGLFLGTPVIATDTGMRPDGVHLIAQGDRAGFVQELKKVVHQGHGPAPSSADNSNIEAVVDLYREIAA
jgi:glycosyltransferase involved in cell wall biosynthesis